MTQDKIKDVALDLTQNFPRDLPLLPVGRTSFEILRNNNFVYVDKTMYFPELLKGGDQFIFCARPRRFGKSLTLSALDAFYSGQSELFQGLAVERLMCSPDFVTRPVIHINMSRAEGSTTIDMLLDNIMYELKLNEKRHNVSMVRTNYAIAFSSLLSAVHESTGKRVVLLIDEYDSPVIDVIGRNKEIPNKNFLSDTRFVMQNFYSKIKLAENDISVAFITAVTKFARMDVFSRLNNLVDISLSSKFAGFMGYTQEELETYFTPFIEAIAIKNGVSRDKVLKIIKDRYNGFSFDGSQMLYNPFSILTLFNDMEFGNFWMESGSNTFIRNYFNEKAFTVDEFEGKNVSYDFARVPGEIDATPPEGFLYQAGYLTLRPGIEKRFALEYPNLEVREAISKIFLEAISSDWNGVDANRVELSKCLASADIFGIVMVLYRLLAGISYSDHLDALRNPLVRIMQKFIMKFTVQDSSASLLQGHSDALADFLVKSRGESYYRSLLQACFWMAGAKVTPEKQENVGRLDLEVYFAPLTYVFELKMSKNARGANAAARSGMLQIHRRGYGLASKLPVFVSIAIGKAERNIVGCLFEKDGHETEVNVEALRRVKPLLSRHGTLALPSADIEKQ
ncbi:MAG: ATP-binding protein [Deltaproteobacteria bacterium]|jgi:hypothetical protein|nr:ATP-binding protein [Deltaproteobacteria bacterium]